MATSVHALSGEQSTVPDVDVQTAADAVHIWENAGSTLRARWICAAVLLTGSAAGGFVEWIRPEPIPITSTARMPAPVFVGADLALITTGYVFIGEIAAYDDELFAYLMFDHLRRGLALTRAQLLLTFDPRIDVKPYRVVVRGHADLITALAGFSSLKISKEPFLGDWHLTPAARADAFEQQTRLFLSAYNLPVRRELEELPRSSLSAYLRRFIQFKSATDPRIRRRLEPVPEPLSAKQAHRLAGDIISVAQFFSLPLEFFLGIGAMENNYMNVRGDLEHSIWKRRPSPDDVILERRRGRVRVLNDSAGVWQITRETLRYAHKLVQSDIRDYTALPPHLQPPDDLDVKEVDPHVLTTYAGVLLRDLLDRFEGDVTLAVSAYNGGPARPNLEYGEGVHRAAAHARRVLEQAAALNGESVVRMTWLRPAS